jgi:hypothetical protein
MEEELTLKLGDKTFQLELNGGSLWDFEEAGNSLSDVDGGMKVMMTLAYYCIQPAEGDYVGRDDMTPRDFAGMIRGKDFASFLPVSKKLFASLSMSDDTEKKDEAGPSSELSSASKSKNSKATATAS